jgi:hypothetical protein
LQAFALLLQVAAASLGCLLTVRVRLGRFPDAFGEVGEDVLLADDRRAVVESERRNRVGPGRLAQRGPRFALDRDLAGEVVEAELGQALPNAP